MQIAIRPLWSLTLRHFRATAPPEIVISLPYDQNDEHTVAAIEGTRDKFIELPSSLDAGAMAITSIEPSNRETTVLHRNPHF